MIKKYRFGQPVNTDAVVMDIPSSQDTLNHIYSKETESGVEMVLIMEEDDIVYGLGEQVRGINKRGFTYISYATDDPVHTEHKHSLYAGHNFFILCGARMFGVFIDDPGRVVFDIGETQIDLFKIQASKNFDFYWIEGESLKDIVKQFRKLIGRSYIPPKWAFGFQQSRWGYQSAEDIDRVIQGYRNLDMPIDAVYMDIDYMLDYKDFTIDENKFPEFSSYVENKKSQNIHLVPIIDAGVKIEKDYDIYEEGIANNYFCKDDKGKEFVAAVWPGRVHFPDFLNKKTRQWFGNKYKILLDAGIDGFWNDMNEPAIFYSDRRLKRIMDEVVAMKDMNLDIDSFFHMKELVLSLSNHREDYQSFYHVLDDGTSILHDQVHNLYGFNMTRAASESIDQLMPEKRILLFSRSSYIGMHRYGGIWTGDNFSWWQHILLSMQQMSSLNMCGILYTGSDIGGFCGDVTEDLLLRWTEFALFTPLMRNHTALGTRNQEVYHFTKTESFRKILRMRYMLLPYLYSEYMKAALNDDMYFRPLSFDYPDDEQAYRVEDQVMVGESIMIAPVYTQNAKGRYVYIPQDMLMVRMRSEQERIFEEMEQGHYYIDVDLDEVVIFIKKNHMIPLAIPGKQLLSIADIQEEQYEWLGYVTEYANYVLYTDDGYTKEYEAEGIWKNVELSPEQFEAYSCIWSD